MDKGGLIVGKDQVLGVQVTAVAEGTVAFRAVHLQRQRGGMHVRGVLEGEDPLALKERFGTRVPIALCIDTDRCVHRVLPRRLEPDEAVRTAFANAPVDELATSVREGNDSTAVSMARIAVVNTIIERFHELGFRVVRTSIGPWSLLSLQAMLAPEAHEWHIGGHHFTFTDGALRAYARSAEKEEATFDPGGEELPQRLALAFATAWDHLLGAPDQHDRALPAVASAVQEEKARYRYEIGLVASVLLLLGLMAAERWAASRLDRLQQQLQVSATEHSRDLEAVEQLRIRVQGLEEVQRTLGEGERQGLAWQAAHLIKDVPAGIVLDRLAMDPLVRPLKEREPLDLRKGTTAIEGRCTNSAELDRWMEQLRRTTGVRGVRLLNYAMQPREGLARFELELDR
ncbi:MAG TPA: hypothetical protein VGE21_05920 [Flavobacteriales bacterium]